MSRQKVLLVSLFHPELIRGGAQQICYELFEGLKEEPGIEPILLASVTSDTYPALFKSGARITGFDGRPGEFLFLTQEYDYWWHKTSSSVMVEAFAEFLELIQPDVVHFHHFFTYGIDLISLTRRVLPNCRIIFTFHEFMSICAADGQMVRRTDRSLCTQASQVRCHQCFPERAPEEFLVRKMWLQAHLGHVDAFTCPSQFMIEHYVRWGIARNMIRHVTNGQRVYGDPAAIPAAEGPKKRFGFFGQLVDNKGVHILLRAVQILRSEGFTDFVVEINGDNLRYASPTVRDEITAFLANEQTLPPNEQIVFDNGSYHVDELQSRMSRVDWCVVPSIWWEIFGLVISEAWMFRRPVICSNIGGPAERVQDDIFGLHFQVGDPRSLASVIRRACTEQGLWNRLSASIPQPPSRSDMIAGFRSLYGST
ncbi:glycosyltransferase family 4 protein [Microvirga arabica]|uniref:glycosyltransferase family 4 protein n=1 Tax=Microvirga arabica TaxID=1128671 RepID=UPI001939C311|nr:glycosyltransferase family 4 protein [Microvirga arabica]MBM1171280.1 glycosyltransferase family 4 protein [Microvirga arabica]